MPIRTIRVARSGLRWFLRWQVPILLALLIGATVGAELYLRGQPLRPYLADLIATQGADLPVHRPVDNVHLLFDLKPGARENLARPHRSDRMVTINALGMRDPERTLEKPPGTFRIVVLGSSTTFGAEVSDGETFPNYAEEILNARRDGRRYEVWNAGISSYTPHQMAAFGRRLIEQGAAPDLIVFQIFLLGPRSFLNGRINLTQYRDDPSLLDEHLVRPSWLSRATAIDLLVRSRLAGLLLAHYNRVVDQKERGAATEAASFEHHIEQLAAFVKDFGDKVRLMAIYMPCSDVEEFGPAGELVDAAGLKMECLSLPGGEMYDELLHPDAAVYRVYGEQLVKMWDARGDLSPSTKYTATNPDP